MNFQHQVDVDSKKLVVKRKICNEKYETCL